MNTHYGVFSYFFGRRSPEETNIERFSNNFVALPESRAGRFTVGPFFEINLNICARNPFFTYVFGDNDVENKQTAATHADGGT